MNSWRLLAVLWLAACTRGTLDPAEAPKDQPAPFQHVVLIVIDTLRADVLQTSHTPHLDTLAATGGQVDRAWASGTWTGPSIVSLFTGTSVRRHGWDLPSGRIGRYPHLPELPTLAEVLRDAGFSTTGLFGNPYLSEALGFDRGFQQWSRTSDQAILRSIERVALPRFAEGGRHFLYLHLMGPHSPLLPTASTQERLGLDPSWFEPKGGLRIGVAKRNQIPGAREAYAKAYQGVVEDTDVRIGEILQALEPLGEDTLIVVTSDHGELLGEHDVVGHGRHVWEPLTHVPLIMGKVSHLPPRMTIAGIPSLITQLTAVPHAWPASLEDSTLLVAEREGLIAISQDGKTKTIWGDRGEGTYQLDLDPGEINPLPLDPIGSALREAWEARTPAGPKNPLEVVLKTDTQLELKALGYAE